MDMFEGKMKNMYRQMLYDFLWFSSAPNRLGTGTPYTPNQI